jgi:glyoxylate/hydroxypyruvate reductase
MHFSSSWFYFFLVAGRHVTEGEKNLFCDVPRARRCMVVPHIGSATFETRLGMVNLAARNALTGVDEEAMCAW